MRTFPALALLVFLSLSCSSRAGDEIRGEIRGEMRVTIPANTQFKTNAGSEGTTWIVDIDLDARYHYAGAIGEPLYNFCTKMTMKSVTASQALTYTDRDSGQTATAPTVFRPGDRILDELGARKEFDKIKLLKAYFRVRFTYESLEHVFWDQEVFAPSGEWGTNLGWSSPQWNAFLFPRHLGQWAYRSADSGNGVWAEKEGNNYSQDEIKDIKKRYAGALRTMGAPGDGVTWVALLANPEPEFAGLLEFENAIMGGLREKVKGMPKKPAVSANALNKAFTKKSEQNAAPSSQREAARTANVNDILAKRLAAVRDASRQKISSAIASGNVSALGDLPRLRGQWQAINRYIAKEKVFLLDPTRNLNREVDETVNLKSFGIVSQLENAIALAAARAAAATLGTVNFTCRNHTATVSDAGNGKIRFNDTVVDIREMTDARSTSGGGSGTLEIFTRAGMIWTLGDCGNIDAEAARKLELVSGTLRQGIEQQKNWGCTR